MPDQQKQISEMKMTLLKEPVYGSKKFSQVSLPALLKEIYGGDYFFVPEAVSSSYVISKEGIYSVKGYGPEVIAQNSKADAFTLSLGRVFADFIILTAGTVNAEPNTTGWGFQTVFGYPQMKEFNEIREEMSSLRKSLGKEEYPGVYFMTNSGELNPNALIFYTGKSPVFVVTNEKTKKEKFPNGRFGRAEVYSFGEEILDTQAFIQSLGKEKNIRYEGGRKGLGSFLSGGLLGQLTVTQMPFSPSVPYDQKDAEYVFDNHMIPEDKIFSERIGGTGERIATLDFRGVKEI